MLFGSKSDFAIEAMIEPGLALPSAVYGRMQVWCTNTSLGDFSDPRCSLYSAYRGFTELVAALPDLWRSDLDGLSDEQLINRLDRLLYGAQGDQLLEDDGRTVSECKRDWAEYGVFNFLTNWGEQFDREDKAFIFCPPTQPSKILILQRRFDTIRSLHTSIPAATDAIHKFLRWFDESAARLADPNPR
ncbi:hypothetical protein PQR46_32450 [Paraburkholderia sediminicola]|uniref:hypothetical protein n=1 Tax=Paraburkholderia TaxID=1822464 RepID=UPI0019092DA2|nr:MULTISPECIES: hypothetical protein [Paraburkholderia]MBK3744831.1 hypothetical protein [Paraburkholderia aspalathi]MBK3786492.1 hypothetical protein [Paraburkholderia aspalathi]CAE6741371.1 hypothetical protein R75461_02488 [Paraburkholderia nemoris]CAE6850670.1 hypothetical protein R69619_07434 [Paraburkholderia nemoris]